MCRGGAPGLVEFRCIDPGQGDKVLAAAYLEDQAVAVDHAQYLAGQLRVGVRGGHGCTQAGGSNHDSKERALRHETLPPSAPSWAAPDGKWSQWAESNCRPTDYESWRRSRPGSLAGLDQSLSQVPTIRRLDSLPIASSANHGQAASLFSVHTFLGPCSLVGSLPRYVTFLIRYPLQ